MKKQTAIERQEFERNFYEEMVKTLIGDGSSQILEVKGVDHTAVVLDNLVSAADKEINVFWRTLDQPALNSDRVYVAFERAINRGIDLKLVVQETGENGLSRVRRLFRDYQIPIIPFKPDELQDQNFVSCDGKAFFLWKYSAEKGAACFNDSSLASQLRLDYGSVRKR